MGFLPSFSADKPRSRLPFTLDCSVHPLRLPANKADFVELQIDLQAHSSDSNPVSLTIDLPKALGIDQSALSQRKEVRLGQLRPGHTQTLCVNVYGTQRTQPGSYNLRVTAATHYHDYSHVLNEVSKTITLRVA